MLSPSLGWDNSPWNNSCHFIDFCSSLPSSIEPAVPPWEGGAPQGLPAEDEQQLQPPPPVPRLFPRASQQRGRPWSEESSRRKELEHWHSSLCLWHPAAGAAARRWGALPGWCDGAHTRTSPKQSRIVLNTQREAAVPGCSTPAALGAAGAQSWQVGPGGAGKGAECCLWGGETWGDSWDRARLTAAANAGLSDLPPSQSLTFGRRRSMKLPQSSHGHTWARCGCEGSEAVSAGRAGRCHPAIGPSGSWAHGTARRGGVLLWVPDGHTHWTLNSSPWSPSHQAPARSLPAPPWRPLWHLHETQHTDNDLGGICCFFLTAAAHGSTRRKRGGRTDAHQAARRPSAPGPQHPAPRPPFSAAASSGPMRGYAPASLRVAIATSGRLAPAAARPIGRRRSPPPSPGAGRGVSSAPEARPQLRRVCVRAPSGCRAPVASPVGIQAAVRAPPPPPGEGLRPPTPRSPAGPRRRCPAGARGVGGGGLPLPPRRLGGGGGRGGRAPRREEGGRRGRAAFFPPFSRRRRSVAAPSNGVTLPRRPLRSPRGRRRLPPRPHPPESLGCRGARPRTPGRSRGPAPSVAAREGLGRGEGRRRSAPGAGPSPAGGPLLPRAPPFTTLSGLRAFSQRSQSRELLRGPCGALQWAVAVRMSLLRVRRGDQRNVFSASEEDIISIVLFLILNYSYLVTEMSLGSTAERKKVTSCCPQHIRRLGSSPELTTLGLIWGMYNQILIGMVESQGDTVTVLAHRAKMYLMQPLRCKSVT